MNCDPPSGPSRDDRIVHLETLVTHLQYDLEQLYSDVLEQQAEIRALRETLTRLERRVDVSSEGPDQRDPLEERPPHY